MVISSELHGPVKQVAAGSGGEKRYPERSSKFTQFEKECCELADALGRGRMGSRR